MFILFLVFVAALVVLVATGSISIGTALAIFMIVVICFAPIWAPMLATTGASSWVTAMFTAISATGWYGSIAIGLGLTWLLLPEETAEIAAKFVADAGEIAVDLAATLGEATASLIGGLLSNPVALVAIGVGLYFFFASDKDKEEESDTPKFLESGGAL